MKNGAKVTIAQSIEVSDILCDGTFKHSHVFDLRCGEEGKARPVEELVLKRLRNHFISYDQMPMDMDEIGPCEEIHLCEMIREHDGDILIITEDVPQVAHLCNIYKIPFTSKVFYVVETGKGDIVKPYTPQTDSDTPNAAAQMSAM
jgi:hypothetical protein